MTPFALWKDTEPVKLRPLPLTGGAKGIVRDTQNVREAENKYCRPLVGLPARWQVKGGYWRTEVFYLGKWCGTVPLTEADLEKK